ncbi:MAG: 3-keto-disaccharide hydrolase [Fimbriiglobus sp.]
MLRLLSLSVAMGAMFLVAQSQEPKKAKDKAKAEKPVRIAVNDPKDLKDHPDFAIQGEYYGTSADGRQTTAAQVVAQGNGKFVVNLHSGSLPGAGSSSSELASVLKAKKTDAGYIWEMNDKSVGRFVDGVMVPPVQEKYTYSIKKIERKSPTLGAKPPEGAEVLFDQPEDVKNWKGGKIVELSDGKFLNNGIKSEKSYGSITAHVEFRLPWMPNSTGQGRGNSGVYLQDRYEVQVLDSFGLKGENNECGGIYTISKPKINMCLPPMVWQTYDIDFTAAEFDAAGKKTKSARISVKHNGVLIQDNVELKNTTASSGQGEGPTPGPIQLQNHGDPVVYRNIWVKSK